MAQVLGGGIHCAHFLLGECSNARSPRCALRLTACSLFVGIVEKSMDVRQFFLWRFDTHKMATVDYFAVHCGFLLNEAFRYNGWKARIRLLGQAAVPFVIVYLITFQVFGFE